MTHNFLMSNCEKELFTAYALMLILWVQISIPPLRITTCAQCFSLSVRIKIPLLFGFNFRNTLTDKSKELEVS